MIPVGCSQGELRGLLLLGRADGLKVFKLRDVGGPSVPDLADADYGFGGELLSFFVEEGGDVWDIGTEEFWVWVADLLEPFKARKE